MATGVLTYPGVPPFNGEDVNDWLFHARLTINGCLNGKTNNTSAVTLTSSTATTVVTLAKGRLGPNTIILFEPTTATAAAELAAGTMWVSSKDVAAGVFRITNSVSVAGDRTFNFILVG